MPGRFLGNDLLEAVQQAEAYGETIDQDRWNGHASPASQSLGQPRSSLGM